MNFLIGCSESNSYYLQEQYMLLTVDHRSSPLRVFFPLKLPLKAKGKILNVFSHTLKSAYDTPIPVLWFDSRSCCSLLPCSPQDISLSSGLGSVSRPFAHTVIYSMRSYFCGLLHATQRLRASGGLQGFRNALGP